MRKIITIVLILSLFLLLLGCTPDEEGTTPASTPQPSVQSNGTEAATQTNPLPLSPDASGEVGNIPANSGSLADPGENPPATEPFTEEEDEVLDTYIIIIDDNLGVGGN